jgi:glycerophosphoryl diester phosphodiesterase
LEGLPDVRVIAHRGSSARAPENTLAAFRAALDDGADGIELDARLTADGVVVVMHDDDIARTTNGEGRVSEMSFEQLPALRASGFELIPSLEEVLALVGGRTAIVVEIKGAFGGARTISGEDVARAVLPLIDGVPFVLASSFDLAAVAVVRALAPSVPTAITIGRHSSLDETLSIAIAAGHSEIHLPHDVVDQAFVARAHEAGRAVVAYTVNDRARARELEEIGLDGIFSDDPAGVRAR